MPYINFAWYPRSDSSRVSAIIDDLRAVADEHDVGFYINAKEEEEPEPVVVSGKVNISADVVERLRVLAKWAGVTIYVNPPS